MVHIQGAGAADVRPLMILPRLCNCAPNRVGWQHLYCATADGEPLRADVRQVRDGVLPMAVQSIEPLELALKGAVRVERFFHDYAGLLNTQVCDAREQLHSVPLGTASGLRPEWNLSDMFRLLAHWHTAFMTR